MEAFNERHTIVSCLSPCPYKRILTNEEPTKVGCPLSPPTKKDAHEKVGFRFVTSLVYIAIHWKWYGTRVDSVSERELRRAAIVEQPECRKAWLAFSQ